MARTNWEALGSTVVLQVEDPDRLAAAEQAVRRELDGIDQACSRFKTDSELSELNNHPGHDRQISVLLSEAISMSLAAARETDGVIDPAIGRALQIAGYDVDFEVVQHRSREHRSSIPTQATDAGTVTVRQVAGWRSIRLDLCKRVVRVPPGMSLDVGAVAKAWAADRASAAAHHVAGCRALVGIGGDIALAGEHREDGWLVHVTDDHRSSPTAPGQTLRITGGGLATSSTVVRRWQHAGRDMHHIIDPRTGTPARSCWRTVTVAAATCAEANIAATAALVMSSDGPEWLDARKLPARLVTHDGAVRRVAGWPPEGLG